MKKRRIRAEQAFANSIPGSPPRIVVRCSVYAVLAVFLLLQASCSSFSQQQSFLGPPEFQAWMGRALNEPDSNPAFHRFALAYRGSSEGLHAYFSEALRQAESPEINVEASEALSWELRTILHRIGDARFAAALAGESERVRSALASCFRGIASPAYPRTNQLLQDTPKLDFPMLKV